MKSQGDFFAQLGGNLSKLCKHLWNDPEKPLAQKFSRTMTVVFTGQGSTELAENGIPIGFLFLEH